MAAQNGQPGLLPSILDRLIDSTSAGTSWQRGYDLTKTLQAVQRDLENLLNTHQSFPGQLQSFPETANSIAGYGLPEVISFRVSTPQQREQICQLLQETILRFEPRLKDVRATALDNDENKSSKVRFRIDARLVVEPAPEVAFETVLELTTGKHSVRPTIS
jgi:type VI secretion system protein ImpF